MANPRTRTRQLTRKFISTPVLPALGVTKVIESVVAGGATLRWAAYALVVLALWVYGHHLKEVAEGASEVVEDATEGLDD